MPTIVYAAAIVLIGGWAAFFWGYLAATVLLYHGTFLINSLSHIWGTRRFPTPDESRNNFMLALVTLGEGWHNNHHHYMSSVRQGIRWWEIDITYYVIVVLSWVGITRDLREYQRRVDEIRAPACRPNADRPQTRPSYFGVPYVDSASRIVGERMSASAR